MKHVRVTGIVASAAAVMLAASPSFATLAKCSKLIDSEVLKMQSTFAKGFGKCNDAYQKDLASKVPLSPPFSKAAPACEKELGKAFATLSAEVGKLSASAGGTCTDSDLLVLGHLPKATFGNRWAETQGVGALQSAYEQQLLGTKNWVNQLQQMGNGPGDTPAGPGTCATCKKLVIPPCSETACKLAGASAAVDLAGSPTITVPLSGNSVLKICDTSTLISSSAGVLYVIGGPGKLLDPAPVGAIATSCTTQVASEGLIQCGSGASKINYTTCVDHNTGGATNPAGATSSGSCTGQTCNPSVTDVEDPTIVNGGACLTLTGVAGTAGDAYINLVSRIALHAPGSDCLDEPTTFGQPQNTALTTGTAQATVKNADGNAGTTASSLPNTGAAFNCATIKRGDAGPVKLVGAFPAVNTLQPAPGVLLDSVTGFSLQCEPSGS